MDMKKILQAFDGASKKPVGDSSDMKKFLRIVEGQVPQKQTTRETITSPVLNVAKDASPSMAGKYFKKIEEEFKESEQRYKDRATTLAERVAKKVMERVVPGQESPPGINRLTGKPIDPGVTPTPVSPQSAPSAGYSKEYLQKAADPNRVGGFLMSVEKAQELLKQLDQPLSVQEETEGVDSVTLDVPLLIRLMEFAREDAADDMVLHKVAEKLVGMAEEGQSLSMSDYESIVGQLDEACWKTHKQIGMKKKGGRTVPNCVPK